MVPGRPARGRAGVAHVVVAEHDDADDPAVLHAEEVDVDAGPLVIPGPVVLVLLLRQRGGLVRHVDDVGVLVVAGRVLDGRHVHEEDHRPAAQVLVRPHVHRERAVLVDDRAVVRGARHRHRQARRDPVSRLDVVCPVALPRKVVHRAVDHHDVRLSVRREVLGELQVDAGARLDEGLAFDVLTGVLTLVLDVVVVGILGDQVHPAGLPRRAVGRLFGRDVHAVDAGVNHNRSIARSRRRWRSRDTTGVGQRYVPVAKAVVRTRLRVGRRCHHCRRAVRDGAGRRGRRRRVPVDDGRLARVDDADDGVADNGDVVRVHVAEGVRASTGAVQERQRDVGAVHRFLVFLGVPGDAGPHFHQVGLRVVHAEHVRLRRALRVGVRIGHGRVAGAVRGHQLVQVVSLFLVGAAGRE